MASTNPLPYSTASNPSILRISSIFQLSRSSSSSFFIPLSLSFASNASNTGSRRRKLKKITTVQNDEIKHVQIRNSHVASSLFYLAHEIPSISRPTFYLYFHFFPSGKLDDPSKIMMEQLPSFAKFSFTKFSIYRFVTPSQSFCEFPSFA